MTTAPTEETYQLMFAMAIFLLILALGCLVYIHQIARELVAKQPKTISPRPPNGPPSSYAPQPPTTPSAGTQEARLDGLLKQLAARFPTAIHPLDPTPHEITYLLAIDDMLSERKELRRIVYNRGE